MPKRKRRIRLYDLTKMAAKAQLRGLLDEARLVLKLFPDLRDSFDADELPLSFIVARRSGRFAKRKTSHRRRPKRITGARKTIGQRLNKHWAVRRRSMKR